MKKNKNRATEDIEFYTKQYIVDETTLENDEKTIPHIQVISRPNPNAWTSFILGIISTIGWILPIIGVPVTIVGTTLGAIGMKQKRNKGIAIAGMVINIVFLCASIAKAIVDLVLYVKHKQN